MSQNERIVGLPLTEFEQHCETLALQILRVGIRYDWAMVLLNGAHDVWSYLREVLQYNREIGVQVTRYPEGETASRRPPEFVHFPYALTGHGLIVDDCTDDGDTMYESITRAYQVGANKVSSAVVLYKPDNVKIKDPDTGQKWRPTFIGWDTAPGRHLLRLPPRSLQEAGPGRSPSVAG